MSHFSTEWADDDLGIFMNALTGWSVSPRETVWEAQRNMGLPSSQVSGQGAGGNSRKSWFPHVDVGEAEDHYEMWVDLPGLQGDDIHLDVKGNVLVVKGKKKYGCLKETLIVRERNMGKFYRVIPLPTNIDPGKVTANYENGVLHILVPKPSAGTKGTKIKIGTHSKAKNSQGQHIGTDDQESSLPANLQIPVHTEEDVNLSDSGIGREAGKPAPSSKQQQQQQQPEKFEKKRQQEVVREQGYEACNDEVIPDIAASGGSKM